MTRRQIFRIAQRVMLAAFAADLIFISWFGDLLVRERATAPHGIYTMALAAHGSDVFLSPGEYRLYWGAWAAMWVIFVVHALFYFASGGMKRDMAAKRLKP